MAISDIIRQIRTAVYGKDVRNSIAEGIEECYDDVQAGATLADAAAIYANSKANAANTAANAANTAANVANTAANTAVNTANTAANAANTAANAANAAAQEIRGLGFTHVKNITAADLTSLGARDSYNTTSPTIMLNSTTVFLRTKLFRVYQGQKFTLRQVCHFGLCRDTNMSTSEIKHWINTNTNPKQITMDSDGYAYVAMTYTVESYPSDPQSVIMATVDTMLSKYSEANDFYIDDVLADTFYGDIVFKKRYTSDGLWARSFEKTDIFRGAAFPYEGPILYTNKPNVANQYVFGIAAIGTADSCFATCTFISFSPNLGSNTVDLFILSNKYIAGVSGGWIRETVTLDSALQGNMNGITARIEDGNLIINYIYEGEINTRTGAISNGIFKMLYDRMVNIAACTVQTGTSPNIAFYGKGFKTYEDYYRFVKDINDDSQIVDHSVRIAALEEGGGGGGGGGGGETDWAKGLDLLEFGQEYLYAWLNALNNGSSFKVLFTGDSTTAYYDGTSNGLKEIFQNCMQKAGYSNGTYVNRAVSGINTSTWRSQYLAGDIAETPTLYIIRHGFNNESGETESEMAAYFRTELISALETIRQSLPVTTTSIILMSPNTSDDDQNHRGLSMKKLLDPIVRNVARTYGCGFIDTFRLWYDPGVYADPMYDDPFGDHRSIHPNGLMNRVIISKLFDFAVPYVFRDINGGGGDMPVTRISSSTTVAPNSTVTIPLPSGVTKDQVRVLHGYIEINDDYYIDEAILVQMISSSGITVKNIGNTEGIASVDITLESATSVVRLTTSEIVNMNSTAVLPLPSGVTKDQVRILHGYLYLETVGGYYVDEACEIQLINSSGITVKNIGGARGYVVVDIALESATNVVRLTTSEQVNLNGTAVIPLPSGVTKDQISILHGYLKTGGDYYVDQACEILSISSSGITVKNVSEARDYMIVDIAVPFAYRNNNNNN